MSITTETRWKSFEKIDKERLYNRIISALIENVEEGLTAREVAVILHNRGHIKSNERQATAPRLTELVDKKIVKIIGKRFDSITQRNVAVYTLIKESN